MSAPTVKEVLVLARAVIESRGDVCRTGSFRDPATGFVCSAGAVRLAAGGRESGGWVDPPMSEERCQVLQDAVAALEANLPFPRGTKSITWYNDRSPSVDRILELFDKAITNVPNGV